MVSLPRSSAILFLLAVWSIGTTASPLPDSITYKPAFGTNAENQFSYPALLEEIPGKPGYFLVPEMRTGKLWLLAPTGAGYDKTLFGQFTGNAADEDMGLVGLAFHPDFVHNHKYYIKYGAIPNPPRQLRIDERLASADFMRDSGQAGRRLLTVDEPGDVVGHNGGSPVFGPDGYLYLNFGDGGWDLVHPDAYKNGQNREVLLSKILRIDVDKKDPGLEYAIPKDNPFVDDPNPKVRPEIWAYGVRNPFRIAFDRVTGELYAGDVGWDKFEEIDIIKKGANYGWSIKEGSLCLVAGACDGVVIENPVLARPNGTGTDMLKCIIGGQVYRGDPASPFYGVYFFGDNSLQKVYAFDKAAPGAPVAKEFAMPPQPPVSFTLDGMNNLYLVGYGGTIYKLEHPRLKAMATALRPVPAGSQLSRRALTMILGNGKVTLPEGFQGRYEALTLAGSRLGILSSWPGEANTVAAPRGNGLVILRRLAEN